MAGSGSPTSWPFTGRGAAAEAFAEALADPASVGAVAIGPAGVGTSRLVEECAARAEAAGASVVRCWATPAARLVPLAALAPLLDRAGLDVDVGGTEADPVDLALASVVHGVRDVLADEERTVVVVDHLHHLDDASATVLDRLVHEGRAFLLGSVVEGAAASEGVTGLWTDGRVQRIDVAPLSRPAVETLLHRALGSTVDGAAAAELWSASEGYPAVLCELVEAARSSTALAEVDGVWRLSARPVVGGRSAELVERRIEALGPAARETLEVVVVAGSIGVSELETMVPPALLEALEEAGLIALRRDRRRAEVVVAHPSVADVVVRGLPALRARRLALEAIARVEARGARRFDDPLRIARWRIDATGTAPAEELARAARIARGTHDYEAVERIARVAVESGVGAEATQLLGEALYELGRFREAEAVLADPPVPPATDQERLVVAATRSTNLFWGLVDADAAAAVLAEAVGAVTDPSVARSIVAHAASLTLWSGRPTDAVAELPPLDEMDRRARVEAALVLSPAQALAGRTAEAIRTADEAFAEHLALGEVSAIAHPGTHLVTKLVALTEAGRLDEAWDLGRLGYDLAVEERIPVAKMWFALGLGRVALLRGAVALADRWFGEQTVHARALDHRQPLRLGLAGVAISAAYLGDAARARRAVDELERFDRSTFGFYGVEVVRARAWALAVEGRAAEGRELLGPAGDDAESSGQLTQAAEADHEAVRLGGPAAASVDRLARIADRSDSLLVRAWADHVVALADDDGPALADVADRFERLGVLLHAAEAATAAADAFRRASDGRRATALGNRAAALAASCEGASTPGLARSTGAAPLTAREREIAYLVARGLQSKDIAERLFLSVRTVQNHLQRIYAKLGVTSRTEVGRALGAGGPEGPGDPGDPGDG